MNGTVLRSVTKTSKQVWRERAEQQGPETQRGKKSLFHSFIHRLNPFCPSLGSQGCRSLWQPVLGGGRKHPGHVRQSVAGLFVFLFMPNPFRPCIPLVSEDKQSRQSRSCRCAPRPLWFSGTRGCRSGCCWCSSHASASTETKLPWPAGTRA